MNKLIEIQRELVAVKGQYNKFGGYQYRSSEDILLALKPLLVKHEAVLVVTDNIKSLGENLVYIEAVATITIEDKIYTSSSFARDGLQQKGMSPPQVTNSASSFAKKQALSNLFLIDDTTEVSPDKEEIDKIEKANEEAKEISENKRNDWLKKSINTISSAQSESELKGVFGALYKESQRIDQDAVNKITKAYQNKSKEL